MSTSLNPKDRIYEPSWIYSKAMLSTPFFPVLLLILSLVCPIHLACSPLLDFLRLLAVVCVATANSYRDAVACFPAYNHASFAPLWTS